MQQSQLLDPLSFVQKYPFLLNASESSAFLRALDSSIVVLSLYQEVFPDEFALALRQCVSLLPMDGTGFSTCVIQFFERVNENLFPLHLSLLLYTPSWGGGQLPDTIPLAPIGFDLEEEAYEDLRLGWQLLLYLIGEVDKEFLGEYADYLDDDILFFHIAVEPFETYPAWLLEQRCRAQGGPLADLYLALQMLRNDTDSLWLDSTANNPYLDARWTKEDIADLAHQYQVAQAIVEKATCFREWLEEEPHTHFTQVARLWNACVQDTPREPSWEPRVMTISAQQFVEGIDLGALFGRHIALSQRCSSREGESGA